MNTEKSNHKRVKYEEPCDGRLSSTVPREGGVKVPFPYSTKYNIHRDCGFGDRDICLIRLSQLGDPLKRLNNRIDFELFSGIDGKRSEQTVQRRRRPSALRLCTDIQNYDTTALLQSVE